jgi:Flavin-binding monooxygenase-like
MRDYLESFARHFGLYEHITFETGVVGVCPRGPRGCDGWTVRTGDGQVREYTAVLVANGHLTDPVVPAMASDFTGRSMHSHDYMKVADVEGDRVATPAAPPQHAETASAAAAERRQAAERTQRQPNTPRAVRAGDVAMASAPIARDAKTTRGSVPSDEFDVNVAAASHPDG